MKQTKYSFIFTHTIRVGMFQPYGHAISHTETYKKLAEEGVCVPKTPFCANPTCSHHPVPRCSLDNGAHSCGMGGFWQNRGLEPSGTGAPHHLYLKSGWIYHRFGRFPACRPRSQRDRIPTTFYPKALCDRGQRKRARGLHRGAAWTLHFFLDVGFGETHRRAKGFRSAHRMENPKTDPRYVKPPRAISRYALSPDRIWLNI